MSEIYDVIIIGAGPAGMSAALYLRRANKKVLLLEAQAYGGKITRAHLIENYPGIQSITGFDFATALYNQITALGATIKYETVKKIEEDNTVVTGSNSYKAKAIIIATGADNKKLGIAREQEFLGKGLSYCATCDGAFFKGEDVAVVGGGDTALEDAIYLSDIAKNVYLIHRGNEFKAQEMFVEKIKKKRNVIIKYNTTVKKLRGDDYLEGLVLNENGTEKSLDVSGVFIAVGLTPSNEIFGDIIETDDHGYIISKDGVHTNREKIYVAGDARSKELRQLATAVSDGAIAATTAIKEMKG